MATLVLKNIAHLVTMNDGRRTIHGAYVFVRDGRIEAVGPAAEGPKRFDRVVDCSWLAVMPGMINTHHHFYQTMTRNLPNCQDAKLFDWLLYLFDIWAKMTPEALRSGALVAAAELLASGCTTSVDHAYVYPDGNADLFDVEVAALKEAGIRMHLCRGSMSLSREDGGLPPKCVVQTDDQILSHCEQVIERYHEADDLGMMRVVLAPCSPFSVTADIMRRTVELAEKHDVLIHTHLAETQDEDDFCIEKVGMRPAAYLDSLGWMRENAFFAHCVWLNDDEIRLMAERKAGVAHCPVSNMRLGSGIAPIVPMLKAGVKVSIAVDGSASNDSSNMLAEARQAMLLQRVKYGASSMTGMQALEVATLGGAAVLNRSATLGSVEKGKAADLIGIRMDTLEYAGGQEDPALAPIFCFTKGVDLNIVNGEVLIEKGAFTKLDVEKIVADHNRIAHDMVRSAGK